MDVVTFTGSRDSDKDIFGGGGDGEHFSAYNKSYYEYSGTCLCVNIGFYISWVNI